MSGGFRTTAVPTPSEEFERRSEIKELREGALEPFFHLAQVLIAPRDAGSADANERLELCFRAA
jgi:hypothetical protein